jgi:hypothetical protein
LIMKQEKEFVEQELEEMRVLKAAAESNRRERSTMPTSPIPGLVDYAAGGVAADNGWQHLNESIVNGQKLRTEAAAELVTLGLYHQLRWLAAAGYKVPTLLWHWNTVSEETVNGNLGTLQQQPATEIDVERWNAEVLAATPPKAETLAWPRPYNPLEDAAADGFSEVHAEKVDPELMVQQVGAVGVRLRHSKSGVEVTSTTEPTEQSNYEQAKRGMAQVLRMQFLEPVTLTLKNPETGASLHIPKAVITKPVELNTADFEEHLVSWPQAKVTRFARLVAALSEQLYRDSPVQNAEAQSLVNALKEISK